MEENGEKEEDQPPPQSVILSQTCWEYKTLLEKERTITPTSAIVERQTHDHDGHDEVKATEYTSGNAPSRTDFADEMSPKRCSKTTGLRTRCTRPTTALRALREASTLEPSSTTWDIFVLVLHTSGLQRIMSRAGIDLDVCTILVADPTSSFFKVTLWRRVAKVGAELIHPGDLVRFNRVGVSTFRGTVQANSGQGTSFRVVWRGDAFVTHHDAPKLTMHPRSHTARDGRGRRFLSGLTSDEDPLAVSRDAGCDLATWAKREFPSVTATDVSELMIQGAGSRPGSLEAVRKGVETTVRACVTQVTGIERLWMWGSEKGVKGERRKDLVARATALLTDGHQEMTLQLWGDLATEELVAKLKEGVATTRHNTSTASTNMDRALPDILRPAVFEFTRLRPEFSFSCEALVLNTTTNGTCRALHSNSPEAIAVADAVARYSKICPDEPLLHVDSKMRTMHVRASWSADDVASIRRFDSVSELVTDHGFSGVCYLDGVIVRKAEIPDFEDGRTPLSPGVVCGSFHSHFLYLYIGDPDEPESETRFPKSGRGPLVCVAVDGSALSDLLCGIPCELLGCSTDSRVNIASIKLVRSFVDGLVVGSEQGERFNVMLACSASEDANGRVTPGGRRYRLVSFHYGS